MILNGVKLFLKNLMSLFITGQVHFLKKKKWVWLLFGNYLAQDGQVDVGLGSIF